MSAGGPRSSPLSSHCTSIMPYIMFYIVKRRFFILKCVLFKNIFKYFLFLKNIFDINTAK